MPRKKKAAAKQTPKKATPSTPKAKPTPSPTKSTPTTVKKSPSNKPTTIQPAPVELVSSVSPSSTTVVVAPTSKPKESLATLFETYSIKPEEEEEEIEEAIIAEEKLESLFKDMSVDPDGRLALIFAWSCGCRELGVIRQNEFKDGMKKLGFDEKDGGSLTKISQELKKKETALMRDTTLSKNADWKDFYLWGFNICREGPDKRGIEKALAVGMLKLILGEKKAHVSQFCSFIERDESVRVISQDFWSCFCEFSNTISDDLKNYDEEEAWPCLIDQYVAHRKGGDVENLDVLVK